MSKIYLNADAINALDLPQEQKRNMITQLSNQLNAEQSQYNKEFERYKQDCRKRALDVANSRVPYIRQENDWIPTHEEILKQADDYYAWLIKDFSSKE